MKQLICLAIAFCGYFLAVSQPTEKTDVVFKNNGDQLKGTVVEVTDDQVRFKYSGEQVIYTFKKREIQKITFSSGRTETYNSSTSPDTNSPVPVSNTAPAAPNAVQPATGDRSNKIAILPFSFLKNGQSLPPEAGEEIQNECFNHLSQHSGTNTVINPRTTNVILAKAGIDKTNMVKHTMTEICQILGVEYVVAGFVDQSNTSETSSSNRSYDFKNDDKKSNRDRVSGSSTSSSNTSQNFDTFTTINIYNDKSENIYSQRRKALFSTIGAYKNTIGYLLKRSPLYVK